MIDYIYLTSSFCRHRLPKSTIGKFNTERSDKEMYPQGMNINPLYNSEESFISQQIILS